MQEINFNLLIDKQRQFFASGATLSIPFRIEQLKKLKWLLLNNESHITDALKKDLNKAPAETIFHEILLVIKEIDFVIKHLKKWSQPKKVTTPFFLWPGRSEIHFEPYGIVLMISPWNYPCMLLMSPLIGAMSAGNCVIVKPSEIAMHTQVLLLKLINDHFPSEYIHAVQSGPEQTQQLLQEKFDYIFFTGGTQIGKIVMEAAAKHLTPITLELGGKNPCIVDETADLDFAAQRIAWGKTINAGQVCLSPDYLYVHHSSKETLIKKIIENLKRFYGDHPEQSPDYGRIVNQHHFQRLSHFLRKGTILFGGEHDEATRYISPTLIVDISWNDPIMQEEIFGPLLPIFTYEKLEDVIHLLKPKSKPLALYLFSQNKYNKKKIVNELSFGGGCVNDCIVQIANLHLPFGGVGHSGLGHYHGKYSFDTFSHFKSLYQKSFSFSTKLEYPPYSQKKLQWLRRLFNFM